MSIMNLIMAVAVTVMYMLVSTILIGKRPKLKAMALVSFAMVALHLIQLQTINTMLGPLLINIACLVWYTVMACRRKTDAFFISGCTYTVISIVQQIAVPLYLSPMGSISPILSAIIIQAVIALASALTAVLLKYLHRRRNFGWLSQAIDFIKQHSRILPYFIMGITMIAVFLFHRYASYVDSYTVIAGVNMAYGLIIVSGLMLTVSLLLYSAFNGPSTASEEEKEEDARNFIMTVNEYKSYRHNEHCRLNIMLGMLKDGDFEGAKEYFETMYLKG